MAQAIFDWETALADSLKSPNGRIEVQAAVKEVGSKSQLNYSVKLDGETLVDESTVTFVRSDKVVIGDCCSDSKPSIRQP